MLETGLRKLGMLAVVAGLASLGSCTYWSNDFDRLVDQSGRDFSRKPEVVYRNVELDKLIQNASNYMLMNVGFWGILNRRDEKVFVTMYSTFLQEDYCAISLWPMNARLWEEADRLRSVPTIYIRKDNPDLQKIIDAPRYSIVQIRGRVMGDYDSGDEVWGRLPFVEVTYFDVAMGGPGYDDETIKLMASGLEDAALKRPAQAIDKLSRAVREGTLEPVGRGVALARLGILWEERGKFQTAVEYYEMALDADPDNVEAREGLERAQKALDRQRAIEAAAPPK